MHSVSHGALASSTLAITILRSIGRPKRLKPSRSSYLWPIPPYQSRRTFPSDRCSGGRFSDSPTQTPRLHFPSQQLNVSMIQTRRRRDLDGIIAISISWEWGMTWMVRLRHATPRAFETSVHRNVSRTLCCHVPKRRSLSIALSHEVCCPQK